MLIMEYIQFNNLYKVYGKQHLAIDDFNLAVKQNEFIALIGPSGCGKSTLLRMIAGLEEISGGELIINDRVVNDVHAKDRDIAMVFQNYALYPHLNVFENIAFGLKIRKISKDEIAKRVHDVAGILDLDKQLEKTPSELSGGQRQRVALGRAMVQQANVLLMDEPLSNLDAKLRNKMRKEIIQVHKKMNVTTIYVTHDQIEAMTMADRIVVMNHGEIQQIGSPKELYEKPNNLFVAKFIGDPEINVLEGVVESDGVSIAGHHLPVELTAGLKQYHGKKVLVGIRPADVYVENIGKETYPNFTHQGAVELIEMRGDHQILNVPFGGNEDFTIKTNVHHEFKLDEAIEFALNPRKIIFFDATTETVIK